MNLVIIHYHDITIYDCATVQCRSVFSLSFDLFTFPILYHTLTDTVRMDKQLFISIQ